MKLVNTGVVYASGKHRGLKSCTFPSICVSPSGQWLCAFRAAPSKAGLAGQKILVTHSADEGHTWSEPTVPFHPINIGGKNGHLRFAALTALADRTIAAVSSWVDDSDPSLPYFNPDTEGLLDTRVFLSRSTDDGATWSQPAMVDTAPFLVPTPITGPLLRLQNGDLACQFEINKPYRDPSLWRHSSVLLFSRDGGRSWPEHAIASNDPTNRIFYWDQRPAVLSDGQILDVFWTYDNQKSVYLNMHARVSSDHGRNWSDLWDTHVPGQPAPPVDLPDGRLGLVYVDRTAAPAIKMRTSKDGGRNWPESSELILHVAPISNQTTDKGGMNDAWDEMSRFSLGLPATARTPDGDVLVVFYSGPGSDETSIRWVRVTA